MSAGPTASGAQRARAAGSAPVWFRGVMGALSRTAPPLAAVVAERLFVRPPGRRLRSAERACAEAARAVIFDTPSGRTSGWRWGEGPETVLLVHGWGGRGPQLGEIGRALVARGYTALSWDMPGHGERSTATTLPEMAAATAAIAGQTDGVAGVVAHSFGMATTLVATRDGLVVPRLVGVAPSALLHRVSLQFGDLTGFSPAVVERMRSRLSARLGFEWQALEAATLAPHLGCPALVIHDEGDERVPLADALELARLLRAETVTTRGLGHAGALQDPATLARIAGFFPPAGPRPLLQP